MPFHGHGQYANALLVESSNFTAQTGASYTASAGDIVAYTPTAASVVNLPPVGNGGPVTVLNLATTTGDTVTVKTTDSSTINGVAGATGFVVAVASAAGVPTSATFSSNGTEWFTIS